MPPRLLVLLLLSASVLVYRGVSFVDALEPVPGASDFGRVDLRDARMVVTAVPDVDLDGQPTAGARAGLRVGDVVVAFERADGSRMAVTGLNVVGNAMRRLPREGGGALIVLRREAAAEREVRLAYPTHQPRGPVTTATRIAVTLLLPLLAVGTALLIGLLRPDDPHAFQASLLFLCFSALFGTYYWALPPGVRELATVVHGGLTAFFSYAFMRFFLLFPSPAPLDRRLPWLKHVLLVPVSLVAVLSIAIGLLAGESLAAAERIASLFTIGFVEVAFSTLYIGMLALGMATGAWRAFAAPTPDERRRLTIVIAGAAAGLLPSVTGVLYILATGTTTPAMWVLPVLVLSLPLFPLSFIYAVVRHRVLGVSLAVRRGLQYALMSRGLLLVEGLVVFVAFSLGVVPLIVQAFPDASAGGVATANTVAAAGAVLVLSRVNRRLKTALDRRFFREPYNAQQVLADLGRALEEAAADADRIADALARCLARALHAASAEVTLGGRSAARIVLDRGTGTPADDSPGARGADAIRDALLERWSEAAGGAVVLEFDSSLHPGDLARQLASGLRGAHWREELVRAGLERASLAAALAVRGHRFGWVVLGDKLSEEAYSAEDRELVRAAAQQAAVALDYTKLIGRIAEQEALKRELAIARDVQLGLLPRTRPVVPGLDYDGACRMAREVGGDYFDFLDLGASRLGLAVGDISGKGVSAALLMAGLQACLRSRAGQCADAPAALVQHANASLVESTDPSRFATFFYAVYDAEGRTLRYVNAGHNPPFLLRAGTSLVSRLRPTGMALGFDAEATYTEGSEALAPGDLLLVFTDGLTEALNEEGEEFGEARLAGLLVGSRHLGAADLQRLVNAELDAFCGATARYDDVTIVVAKAA